MTEIVTAGLVRERGVSSRAATCHLCSTLGQKQVRRALSSWK